MYDILFCKLYIYAYWLNICWYILLYKIYYNSQIEFFPMFYYNANSFFFSTTEINWDYGVDN